MGFNHKHLPVKDYEGEHKKINKDILERGNYDCEFPDEYDAFFPEGHSVLQGIIFETYNVNDLRDLGGAIPMWYTKCFILEKGQEEWRKFYEGSAGNFSVGDIEGDTSCGLFRILAQFETDEVKQEIAEVNERDKLRKRIKENSLKLREDVKRLKSLL